MIDEVRLIAQREYRGLISYTQRALLTRSPLSYVVATVLAFRNGIRTTADVITIQRKSASHELSPVPFLLRYAS